MADLTKKVIGNYMSQTSTRNFPLDCSTFDYIANNNFITEIMGNAIGDKTILYGCNTTTTNGVVYRASGYVFLRTNNYPAGEVLYFDAGSSGTTETTMYVESTNMNVTTGGETFTGIYTQRVLKPGTGTESYKWSDFFDAANAKDMDVTNRISILADGYTWNLRGIYEAVYDLLNFVDTLDRIPVGTIMMWCGAATKVPDHFKLCNGQQVSIYDAKRTSGYSEIYEVLSAGNLSWIQVDYNGNTVKPADGYMCLPDLRGRFIVGYNGSDSDYSIIGKIGGFKAITLSAEESGLPPHVHSLKDYYHAETTGVGNYDQISTNENVGADGTDNNNYCLQYYTHDTETVRSDARDAHENRPPYYTLAYIIKVD